MIKRIFLLFFCTLFCFCCTKTGQKDKVFPEGKLTIDSKSLESAGIQHLTAENLLLLADDTNIFVLSRKDSILARFSGTLPDRVYQAGGQGPAEFLSPSSLFFHGPKTIAVHDGMKSSVLLFDTDLNFKNEIKVPTTIRSMHKFDGRLFAFGDFDKFAIFATLNPEFDIIGTYGNRNRKAPFPIFPGALYKGYLLHDGEIADTSWLYIDSTCQVNIIDVDNWKLKTTLKWPNPAPTTQNSFKSRTNMYSSYYIGKHAGYYLVHAQLAKTLKSSIYELKLFNSNGQMAASFQTDYCLIPSHGPGDNGHIYFIGKSENIYRLKIQQLL